MDMFIHYINTWLRIFFLYSFPTNLYALVATSLKLKYGMMGFNASIFQPCVNLNLTKHLPCSLTNKSQINLNVPKLILWYEANLIWGYIHSYFYVKWNLQKCMFEFKLANYSSNCACFNTADAQRKSKMWTQVEFICKNTVTEKSTPTSLRQKNK